MPKKRFVRDEEWMAQPHTKDGPPPSLWWYRRPDRHRVIDAYIEKYKQGRKVPKDFKDDIRQWLEDLSKFQNMKAWGHPRTYRYWSLPSYALAHGMEKATLMKRLREMEQVAAQLFPDSVPSSRKPRPALTAEEKQEIRKRYLDGEDCKALAQQFRIPSSQVGSLCREEKTIRAAARVQAQSGNEGAPAFEDAEPKEPF
jgi:hypothetical protein